MERELIKKKFIDIMDNTDPKVMIEIWNDRCHDEFYATMDIIKDYCDAYFEEKNPIVFLEAAYCFDGEMESAVEKIKQIMAESSIEITDAIKDTISSLERISKVGTFEFKTLL